MTSPFPGIGSFACIEIAGVDARRFAQVQLSGDVNALAPGHWQWNAWLTAQGRVRALMHLADLGNDSLLMVLRGGDAAAICSELTRYLLRMRATLTMQTFTGCSGSPFTAGAANVEPSGAVVLGYGERSLHLTRTSAPLDPIAQTRWRGQDIRLGWPNLPGNGEAEFLPPALGLHRLGAVALDKGCYPGQEIVARLHYRGGHKYQLCHLHGSKLFPIGPARSPDGKSVVWVLDVLELTDGFEVLAVTPITVERNINVLDNILKVISIFDA